MQIISTSELTQSITIIPRKLEDTVNFRLVDKEDKRNFIMNTSFASIDDEFMTISFVADFFKEDRQYFLEVTNISDDSLLWRGMAYCTDETDLQNFKLNG